MDPLSLYSAPAASPKQRQKISIAATKIFLIESETPEVPPKSPQDTLCSLQLASSRLNAECLSLRCRTATQSTHISSRLVHAQAFTTETPTSFLLESIHRTASFPSCIAIFQYIWKNFQKITVAPRKLARTKVMAEH